MLTLNYKLDDAQTQTNLEQALGLALNYRVDDARTVAILEQGPGRISDAASRGIELALNHFQRLVVDNIAQPYGGMSPAIASGNLAGAVDVLYTLGEMRGEVTVNPPADVYAAPVEYGTVPHMPPVEALIGWVAQKGMVESGSHTSLTRSKHVRTTLRTAGFDKHRARSIVNKKRTATADSDSERIAWAIAKTIQKRGTAGRFMFQRAFEAGEQDAQTLIENEVAKEIAAINDSQ